MAGQKAIVDVFINRQAKGIAGADDVRSDDARIQEAVAKAERGHHGSRARDAVIHSDHKSVAVALDRSVKDFVLGRAGARKSAGGHRHYCKSQRRKAHPAGAFHDHCSGLLDLCCLPQVFFC